MSHSIPIIMLITNILMFHVSALPSCSHVRIETMTPTHIDLLRSTLTLIGFLSNRLDRNTTNGIAVPVIALVPSTKNNHLASTVGTVSRSNDNTPPQPININVADVIYISISLSVIFSVFIGQIISHP